MTATVAAEAGWQPTPEVLETSRVGRLARASGHDSFAEFLHASVRDPVWFWDQAVRDLDIPFVTPYEKVLDLSKGKPWADWFVGGTLNVATTCLDRWAEDAPESVAVSTEAEDGTVAHLTYQQLQQQVEGLAALLRDLAVRPGDRVAVYLPMVAEAVVSFLATAKLGAVAVPLFSGFGVDAVRVRLADAGASVLIAADGTIRRGRHVPMGQVALDAARGVDSLHTVVLAERTGAVVRAAGDGPEMVPWPAPSEGPPTLTGAVPVDHPLLLAYTSGTTGRPKGAVHTHGGLPIKVASEAAYQLDIGADDSVAWISDMGWIMGPYQVVAALSHGARLCLFEGVPDHPGPGRLWGGVNREEISVLGMSPTLVRTLMGEDASPPAMASLRILGSTGETWDPASWQWYFDRVGRRRCPVINMSGGTEVGGALLACHPPQAIGVGSLGGPSLGVAVDVFDDEGRSLRGAVGELVCTHPWPGMTRGLYGDPLRYERTYWNRWPDVWVHGDWASVDDAGAWYLHGRSDDTIMVAGKRLGPAEPEAVLMAHPRVVEAAAVGIPDERTGESMLAFVVADEVEEGDVASLVGELRDQVSLALGPAFRPARVVVAEALPKTRSGKVMRRVLRALVTGEELGDLSSLEDRASLDAIARLVRG